MIKKKFSILLIVVFIVLLAVLGAIGFAYIKYPELRKNELVTLNSLLKELDYKEVIISDIEVSTIIQRINDIFTAESEIKNIKKYESEKTTIRDKFDAGINDYKTKIEKYTQIDQSFMPADLGTIQFSDKKNLSLYLGTLKAQFRENVMNYNSTATGDLLRFEVDSDLEIAHMSIDDKVSQMFIFGVKGTGLTDSEMNYLKSQKPGGVVLLGENISSSLKSYTDSIQKTNAVYPVFILTDQEGGTVRRVWWDDTPTPKQIAALKSEDQCKEFQRRADLLNSLGINWNLGIVADVTGNQNSFIYWRTYTSDFNAAGNIVETAVKCSTNTLTTLKHYPGHGSTVGDTHLGPLDINTLEADWTKNELVPFQKGIQAGGDSLMMGHLKLKWLDSANPASLSKADIDYIRNNLKYEGLLITDDMKMLEAGGYSKEDALRQALVAGEDILLYSYNDDSTRNYLLDFAKKEVKNGLISEEDLNLHTKRILVAKNKIIKLGDYIPKELIY